MKNTQADPKHIDAVARTLARLPELEEGLIATTILDSTDPKVHAAMLDALTRHGVLTASYGYRGDGGIWQPGLTLEQTRVHAGPRTVVVRHTGDWREVTP